MPTFKFSAVTATVPHERFIGYVVLTLSCEHTIQRHVKFLKTRYKCPVCYPPRERTFEELHPGNRHSSAWDGIRQARATRTHMRTARTGKGPGY